MSTAASPRDSIAAFAEVQAALSDPFGDRDVTLALRGLDDRAWQSIEAEWTARLVRDDEQAAALAQEYGDAYEAARRAPGKGSAPRESTVGAVAQPFLAPEAAPGLPLTPSGLPTSQENAPTPLGEPAGTGSPAPAAKPVLTPSFLKDRQALASPAPPFVAPLPAAAPGIEVNAPSAPAGIFGNAPGAPPGGANAISAPSASSRGVNPHSSNVPTPGYTGTAAVDLGAIFKSVVPFDPTAKTSPLASAPPPELARAAESPLSRAAGAPMSGETSDVDIGALARQVLAFGGPRTPPAVSTPSVANNPVVPAANTGAPAPAAPVANKPVAPAPNTGAPAPPASVANRPPPPGANTGAPAPLSPTANRPVVTAPPQPANPTFTLDQYAQLSAEIALDSDPSVRAAIFARWGIHSPDALTSDWRARFSADPALAGRWSAAYAHHYARLRAERSPRR